MASTEVQLPERFDSNFISNIAKVEGFRDYSVRCASASEKGDNFLGELFRVELVEKDDSKRMKLILKISPAGEDIREVLPIGEYYLREIGAYTKVLPTLCALQDRLDLPKNEKFYHAKVYPGPGEFLILEDMGLKNFTMYDKTKSFTLDHVKLVVSKMAYLHSLGYVMKKKKPEVMDMLAGYTCVGIGFGDNVDEIIGKSLAPTVSCIDDVNLKARIEKFVANVIPLLDKLLGRKMAHPYNTICHGDSWTNNFLFKNEDGKPTDVVFIDFQILRYCSPVTDLAYMLYSSTDGDFRKNHLKYILEFYYSTLCERISLLGCDPQELYPREIFQKHLDEIIIYGFIMALMIIPFILSNKDDIPDLRDFMKKDEMTHQVSPIGKKRLLSVLEEFEDKNIF